MKRISVFLLPMVLGIDALPTNHFELNFDKVENPRNCSPRPKYLKLTQKSQEKSSN